MDEHPVSHLNKNKTMGEDGDLSECVHPYKVNNKDGVSSDKDSGNIDDAELTRPGYSTVTSKSLDGGYGWVVVFASFFNAFIIDGIGSCFGLIFPHVMEKFGASAFVSSFAGSLFVSLMIMGCIAAALVRKFGYRSVSMGGGMLACSAFVISAFSPNIVTFVLSYGLFAGCSCGLVFLPSIVIVNDYFHDHRGLANGIITSGSGAGLLVLAPVINYLLKEFSLNGTLLIMAGVLLNMTVFSSFYRPPNTVANYSEDRSVYSDEGDKGTVKDDDGGVGDESADSGLLSLASSSGSSHTVVTAEDYQAQHLSVENGDIEDKTILQQNMHEIISNDKLNKIIINNSYMNDDVKMDTIELCLPGQELDRSPEKGVVSKTAVSNEKDKTIVNNLECNKSTDVNSPCKSNQHIIMTPNSKKTRSVVSSGTNRCTKKQHPGVSPYIELESHKDEAFDLQLSSRHNMLENLSCQSVHQLTTQPEHRDYSKTLHSSVSDMNAGQATPTEKQRFVGSGPFSSKCIGHSKSTKKNNSIINTSFHQLTDNRRCRSHSINIDTCNKDNNCQTLAQNQLKCNIDETYRQLRSVNNIACSCQQHTSSQRQSVHSSALDEGSNLYIAGSVSTLRHLHVKHLLHRAQSREFSYLPGAASHRTSKANLSLVSNSRSYISHASDHLGSGFIPQLPFSSKSNLSQNSKSHLTNSSQIQTIKDLQSSNGNVLYDLKPLLCLEDEESEIKIAKRSALEMITHRHNHDTVGAHTYHATLLVANREQSQTGEHLELNPDVYVSNTSVGKLKDFGLINRGDLQTLGSCVGFEEEPSRSLEVSPMLGYTLKQLIRMPSFLLFVLGSCLIQVGYPLAGVYMADLAYHEGLEEKHTAVLMGLLGGSNICGRLLSGALANVGVSPLRLLYLSLLLGGITCLFAPLYTGFWTLALFAGLFGFLLGFFPPLQPLVIVEFFGLASLSSVFGLLTTLKGAASMLGPPLAGWVYDVTGEYHLSFVFGGVVFVISSVVHLSMPWFR